MTRFRVFPRRTKATPDDLGVRIGPPGLFDEADEIDISVTFPWASNLWVWCVTFRRTEP